MKKIIFVFIVFFNSLELFSEEITKIIYIDNSKNYLKKEVIIKQLDSLVKESSDFLIFISNGNDPIIINNLDEYNKNINNLLSKRTPRPNLKVDIRLLNDLFSEKFSNIIYLNKGPSKKNQFLFFNGSD